MVQSMEPITVLASQSLTALGRSLVAAAWAVARRPIVLALTTLSLVASGVACLVVSSRIAGWWHEVLIPAGVDLILAGMIDVLILGALRGFLEPENDNRRVEVLVNGRRLSNSTDEDRMDNLIDSVSRIEAIVTNLST